MSGLRFMQFTEINSWEGETWHFWLQVNGNEAALDALSVRLTEADTEGYDLGDRVADEHTVNVLVNHADGDGYMPEHTKCLGQLVLPEDFDDADKVLYKGGIKDLFRPAGGAR